ncbi:MAG: nucleoside triphosphate diphosphatase [Actinomycetota bacterium]|nr:nucleoside triphosphate diphosphatase [Actinomycetota bacterium]
MGVPAGVIDDDPRADSDGWGFVCDPSSHRVIELARDGAEILIGPASAPDELTAAYGSYIGRRAAASLERLALVMARLRGADGCPWDREQTHESLRVHLVEETYEVLDAIDRGALKDDLREELGDLLLQVAFHAQLAADDGRFDIADVADSIVAKLIHRHPHVFGETDVADSGEVVRNWEAIKAQEKDRSDPFDDIPAGLPALLHAYKTQKRAAGVGFTADEDGARTRLADALGGPVDPESLGDALFWLVALARSAGIDPEGALRGATGRFRHSI